MTLRPQKTALLVAQQIVADIQQRGNVAGDRLPPEKVMLEQYQIGRGTLRESLRFLELQGMITLKPGPGGGPVVEQANGTGLATSLTLLLQFENAPYRDIVEARNSV
ncbi:FadR/GntR family transcriptional regulator, partial [Microbacterium gubbeenense]